MSITEWPVDQRPRERLIKYGAATLTDAELLAIVLRVGVAGKSAVDLAHGMLDHFGSLNALFAADETVFSAIHGLGPAKFALFQAMQELARRGLAEELADGASLCTSFAVRHFLQMKLRAKTCETFLVLFLNTRSQLLACEEMFRGTLTFTSIHPREVVRSALAHNAAQVILAHNHPSGTPNPSELDLQMTSTLVAAMKLIDVRVVDHFVIAGRQLYSFADHGKL